MSEAAHPRYPFNFSLVNFEKVYSSTTTKNKFAQAERFPVIKVNKA
jgi:hypothetical protein